MTRTRKIVFTCWGRGAFVPASSAMQHEDESACEAAVRSIARRSKLTVLTSRSDGDEVEGSRIVANHWTATLGDPCPGGGWTPRAEIWVSVPADQRPFRKLTDAERASRKADREYWEKYDDAEHQAALRREGFDV